MSWGFELWDQYENIAAHTQKGIDFLEKYGHFIRDRCAIEIEYASRLRRLVKNFHLKKKDEEENQFTYCKAFVAMLNEINDLAGQHEVISENLTTGIAKEVTSLVKDLKEERKKHLQEGAKIQNNLQQSIAQLDKAKKNYERAFKEQERASESFQKADADLNLSRAEVEKARSFASLKEQQHDENKNEYASQLQKTNDLQSQHYNELMPSIFKQLQDMDERRICKVQHFMRHSAEIEQQVSPIIERCLEGVTRAADSIDAREDSKLVVERYVSGFFPPGDIPFDDLSTMKNGDSNSTVSSVPTIRADSFTTAKGTHSGGKIKRRGGLFGIFGSNKNNGLETKDDYSDLPPSQRRKKLQQKLDQIASQVQQETAARDGLMKMKSAYEQNPALGDPLSVEGQLTENGHKLDKLRQEQHKYQTYLAEASGKSVTPIASKKNRSSISEESLSRSASDSSVSNPLNNNKATNIVPPAPIHCSSISPESGIGTSHTSLPDEDEFDNADNIDYYDSEPLPVLGVCRALYNFDAQSEGSIPMTEGEELQVIELDQGDGWTRVRRGDNDEGFVPTSYVECLFSINNSTSC